MKRFRKIVSKRNILIVVSVLVLGLFLFLFFRTGTLGHSDIDDVDLERWDRVDGVIVNAESFELDGGNETCWLIIHGYTDSPDSIRELAEGVNKEFGDYVFAPRLMGHAEVPSNLLNYDLNDWYAQVSGDFDRLEQRCLNVNVVGFSFGGALTMRLAEERDLKNVYLIAPYLEPTHKWYYGFSPNFYLNLLADSVVYSRKTAVAKTNSLEYIDDYIGYWNFVLPPVKNSRGFLITLRQDAPRVTEPVLLQHSCGDDVASCKASSEAYDEFSSEIRERILYERSNHVILADYDKYDVIAKVIEFEGKNR